VTVHVRPDLEELASKASDRKGILGMPDDERHRLMEVLLRVSAIAMQAFDCLDADAMSEKDAATILQLPDWCNEFGQGIRQHAFRKMTGRFGIEQR
jgi:hypothetical protein